MYLFYLSINNHIISIYRLFVRFFVPSFDHSVVCPNRVAIRDVVGSRPTPRQISWPGTDFVPTLDVGAVGCASVFLALGTGVVTVNLRLCDTLSQNKS